MPEFQQISQTQHQLAEGPFWCQKQHALYWVDIPAKAVWRWSQQDNSYQHWVMPVKVSAVFTTKSHRLLVCLADGVAYFDPETETLDYLCQLDEDKPTNRSNDAKCDADGILYVGTMDDEEAQSSGRLWRVTSDGEKSCLLENMGISNTLAWDDSKKCFYFGDSMQGKIHAYPWPDFKDVRTETAFIQTPEGMGPDGSTIDAQGNLWNAQWDGSRVVCYNNNGAQAYVVDLPFARPTSCVFGGADMKTLFITSASIGLSQTELKDQPLAGHVVSIHLDDLPNLGTALSLPLTGTVSQPFAGA
ncbi:SMP-30/gluconolactonase/LRE family protein [Marinomonas agarivorans]|nr:SMP-30/gluconolactonase/LRE family protein [Marinomonas agarivorans]